MRNDKEFAEEALRRATVIRTKRRRGYGRIAAGAAMAVCLLLIVSISVFSGHYPVVSSSGAAQSQAPLMFPNAGGYVLVGVIAFALGVAVTLICRKWRERRETIQRRER